MKQIRICLLPNRPRFLRGADDFGFSILEILISIALLGVSFVAYTQFYKNTMGIGRSMSEKTDMMLLRKFVHEHFSCEKTLAKTTQRVNGRLVNVACPGGVIGNVTDIINHDGKVIFPIVDPAGGKDRKGDVKSGGLIGSYRVIGLCDGNGTVPDTASPIQIPSFRFFASRDDRNLSFNRGPLGHPGWVDVFDGNEVECALPDDPGLPLDLKCTAMFVTLPGGELTGEVPGAFFRSSGKERTGYRSPLASLVIRSQRDLDSPTEGRVANWKLKWANKNPDETIGTASVGRRVVDGMAAPVLSEEFTIPGKQRLATLGQLPEKCVRSPEVTETIPVLNQNPGCSYWEQSIDFLEMKNPKDWYSAPLDLLISGVDAGGKKITECSTKLQIVSPLVLVWPKSPSLPEDLDFYPTATRFDLMATGKRVQTGWINGSAAFLAIDRNQNGEIDNGSELFGDASPLPEGASGSKKGASGFKALAVYDDNQDMFIDKTDAVFDKLLLWFDENTDGKSQPWELHPLSAFDVDRIGLSFKEVEKQPAAAHFSTKFVYESSFYGPELCGSKGCRIYDVYFTTTHNTSER